MTRNGIIALVAGVAVAIAAGIWISGLVISNVENRDAPASAEARVGGPFTLVNEAGETVTEAKTFRGRWMLVFFGFSNCPDVCPTELQVMASAIGRWVRAARTSRRSSSPSIPSATRPTSWRAMSRFSIRA